MYWINTLPSCNCEYLYVLFLAFTLTHSHSCIAHWLSISFLHTLTPCLSPPNTLSVPLTNWICLWTSLFCQLNLSQLCLLPPTWFDLDQHAQLHRNDVPSLRDISMIQLHLKVCTWSVLNWFNVNEYEQLICFWNTAEYLSEEARSHLKCEFKHLGLHQERRYKKCSMCMASLYVCVQIGSQISAQISWG